MTIGAAVLDWVQPAYQAKQKQSYQLIALLKKAINQPSNGSTIRNHWHEVQIHPQNADTGPQAENSHFVIDRKGMIRHKHIGPLTAESIKTDILPLLKQLEGEAA